MKCNWFGHKWTKWEHEEQKLVHSTTGKHYKVIYQKRVCTRCNKEQIEQIF